jgi:hypothetical protein
MYAMYVALQSAKSNIISDTPSWIYQPVNRNKAKVVNIGDNLDNVRPYQ